MSAATQISSLKPRKRCAVYCRVSSDERLDQEFNSIDAQKEAGPGGRRAVGRNDGNGA